MSNDNEMVRDERGRKLGEIVRAGDVYQLWKREPPRFPPANRNVLVGTFETIEAAREAARALER